jgi:oxygen-independent coproporphyrinogen-3 oxidase
MVAYSLYLHVPFCTHRCGYCDFNTYAGLESHIPAYVTALCAEIAWLGETSPGKLPIHTIYFGGGTPSLLPAVELERILAALKDAFELQPEAEISLEANPGTLSPGYLRDLHSLGVNRLSLGVQSAHPGELRLLERIHTYPEAIQSVTWARQAGFDNLNLDLIFGLPEQTLQTWQNTLQLALGLEPEHFSLYALTIEPDTPFGKWSKRGLLSPPDPDLAADMYELASEVLAINGYTQYEISNWAKSAPSPTISPSSASHSCRHNLQYWHNLPYLGMGAGAHGYAAGYRTENLLSPIKYIQCFKEDRQPTAARRQPAAQPNLTEIGFPWTPATQIIHHIDRQTEIGETMMMGLRLTETGVAAQAFSERFGQPLDALFGPQIERLIRLGLLEWAVHEGESVLRLTSRGRLLGNQVFMEFI